MRKISKVKYKKIHLTLDVGNDQEIEFQEI
jgi:hypothetical protein